MIETKEDAIAKLKEMIQPGDTIYTIVKHVSKSRQSRAISFYVVDSSRNILVIDYYMSLVLEVPFDKKNQGLKIQGDGMDMCWHTVTNLSHLIFNDEKALHEKNLG